MVRTGTAFNDDLSNASYYVLDDHLGSSNTRLNEDGGIIDYQEYYPFGDTSLRTYNKKRYQYVGKEKDSESGLIYYGARYYAAWTCRFISVDPLASRYKQLTPYQNSGNDPIGDYDIDGMQSKKTAPDNPQDNTSTSGATNAANNQMGSDAHTMSQLNTLSGVNTITVIHNIDGKKVTKFEGSPSEAPQGVIDKAAEIVNNIGSGSNGKITLTATGASEEVVNSGYGFHIKVTYADFDFDYSFDSGNDRVETSGSFKEQVDTTNFFGLLDAALEIVGFRIFKYLTKPGAALGGNRSINPLKGKVNCAGCAQAGDATLEGFPSSALNHGVTSTDDVLEHFGKRSWDMGNTESIIVTKMEELGDGAKGVIFGSRGPGRVGHFFNVVNQGGEVRFLDFQKTGQSTVMKPSELAGFKDFWFINTTY